jgi:hypothetical protein
LTLRETFMKGYNEAKAENARKALERANQPPSRAGKIAVRILRGLLRFGFIMLVVLIVGPKRAQNAAAYSLMRKVLR